MDEHLKLNIRTSSYNQNCLATVTKNFSMTKGTQKERRRRSERIRRKKLALFKDTCKLGDKEGIDTVVIVYQHGQYYLAIYTERSFWPPDIAEIVSEPRLGKSDLTLSRKIPSRGLNSIPKLDGRRVCVLIHDPVH
jgi:hypothetical protein